MGYQNISESVRSGPRGSAAMDSNGGLFVFCLAYSRIAT